MAQSINENLNSNVELRPSVAPQAEYSERKTSLPTYMGKATSGFAMMVGDKPKVDSIAHFANYKCGDVSLKVTDINQLSSALGVNTDKLFSYGVAMFTMNNSFNDRFLYDNVNCDVLIPLEEYCIALGYDVVEHEKETEQEQLKEKNRAKEAMKKARTRIKSDLDVLWNSSLSWEEDVKKGKRKDNNDFIDVRLIDSRGIKDGMIHFSFSKRFGNYLVRLPISQFRKALLATDARNPNAYKIGKKINEHFSMDSNQRKGTAGRLKVKTLLAVTNLPNYETVRANKNRWEDRIKEPFEKALEENVNTGFLEDWSYSHGKGIVLTDEEVQEGATFNYDDWENLYIEYKICGAEVDHERIDKNFRENAERIRSAKENKKLKKSNSRLKAQVKELKKKADNNAGIGEAPQQ